MKVIVGKYGPEWGHTYLTEGFGKLYALRSLPDGSFLRVYEMPAELPEISTPEEFTLLGEWTTEGKHSCHITLLAAQAVVSDYTSGTLSLFDLDKSGIPEGCARLIHFHGKGPDPSRQTCSHIHSSWISPDGKSIIVVDLGCDKIYRYAIKDGRLDDETMETFTLPEGCGPRHCAFHKDRLYVSTELSDELLMFSYPQMELLQRCLVNDKLPQGGGHVEVSADGKYVYVSSRLDNDGIAMFRTGFAGELEMEEYYQTGLHPRHFALSKNGSVLFCADRDSNLVEGFRIKSLGRLSKCLEFDIDKPVCIITK